MERGADKVGFRSASAGGRVVPDSAASAIHPGRLAAESSEVSQESIMRALRQSGSVEGGATTKGSPISRLCQQATTSPGAASPFFLKEIGDHFGLHYSYVSKIISRAGKAKGKT